MCLLRQAASFLASVDLTLVFDEIHFTGAFQHLEPTPEEKEGHAAKRAFVSHKKRSKAEASYG